MEAIARISPLRGSMMMIVPDCGAVICNRLIEHPFGHRLDFAVDGQHQAGAGGMLGGLSIR